MPTAKKGFKKRLAFLILSGLQSSIHLGNNLENILKIRFHINFELTGND